LEEVVGLHLDHHAVVDLAPCVWVAKGYSHQVFATFDGLQLGFGGFYSLHISAIVIDVFDMPVSFQLSGYYNYGPSIEKQALGDEYHIVIHLES